MGRNLFRSDTLGSGRRLPRRLRGATRLGLAALVAGGCLLMWAAVAAAGPASAPTSGVAPEGLRQLVSTAAWVTAAPPSPGAGRASTRTIFADDFESGLAKWQLRGSPGWGGTSYR